MKKLYLFLLLLSAFCGTPAGCQDGCEKQPVVSHVFWITLHAREPAIYDSLYQLLATDLQIPRFFDTETYGTRRYFTVQVGNVILEPCGPFEFHEEIGQDVMTRFNTLAFRPFVSALASSEKLEELGFDITVRDKDALLNLTVDELCSDFLPVNISKALQLNSKDKTIMDSLTHELIRSGGGPIGLEYMEEVHIGYSSEAYLDKWRTFLHPLENSGNLWILPKKPNIRFIPGDREEIRALVFKVKSLDAAARYLRSKGLEAVRNGNEMEMDLGWANGIEILLTQ